MPRKQVGKIDNALLDRVDARARVLGQTRRVFIERALEHALTPARVDAELAWRRYVMADAKEALACGDGERAYAVLTQHERDGYPWAPGVPGNRGPGVAREALVIAGARDATPLDPRSDPRLRAAAQETSRIPGPSVKRNGKLKVYSWQGNRRGAHPDAPWSPCTIELLAAPSIAAVMRTTGQTRANLFNLAETGCDEYLEVALAEPGTVFWRGVDDRGEWKRDDTRKGTS